LTRTSNLLTLLASLNHKALVKAYKRDHWGALECKQQAYGILVTCYGLDHPHVIARQRELRSFATYVERRDHDNMVSVIYSYGNEYMVDALANAPEIYGKGWHK